MTIDDAQVREAVSSWWQIDVESVTYLPVGAGSHHWTITEASGTRYFATVDDLDTKSWLGAGRLAAFDGLSRCYEAANRLSTEAGLDFVIAPIRKADGAVVARLNDQFTLAVLPYIEGERIGSFAVPRAARRRTVELLAELHRRGPAVDELVPQRDFAIPARMPLELALREVDRPWDGGPWAERARAWLATNAAAIIAAFSVYDELVLEVAGSTTSTITHGEPHAGNFMRTDGGLVLIDWDTVAFAPPERDLWLCCRDSPELADHYTKLTGHAIRPAALRLYAVGWQLSDIAAYLTELRAQHQDTADTRRALRVLTAMDFTAMR